MKNKSFNFISPKGTAKYPRLDRAYKWNDSANRSMPDEDGQYDVVVAVPKKDAKPLVDVISEACKEAGFKPKHLPYRPEIDKDTGEETGNVEFTFRAYGKKTNGDINKILFFDAKGRPVPSSVQINGGSTIRCLGYITVKRLGARLNLKEVQIINLVERPASGFDEVEGDFIYEDDENEKNSFATNEETNERPVF